MPATHLISVDFPAPLSPTRAITSPSRTSKSTSVSASTEPNDLEIPRISRSGLSLTVPVFPNTNEPVEAPERAPPHWLTNRLLAELCELADADVALLDELVLEEPLVVLLRDRDDRQLDGRLFQAAVLAEAVDAGDLLLVRQQGFDRLDRCIDLAWHVLVDGHRLPARDDVLHPLNGRILPRQGDRLQVMRLQARDDRTGDVVVRRDCAVDLVARLEQHLLEDRLRVRRQPERDELLRAFRDLVG